MDSIIVTIIVRLLEGMFVIGSLGSLVVLGLTAIEDLKLLLGLEDDHS